MKVARVLVILLSISLLRIAANAASTVVSPTVGAEFHGALVQLEFVVDANGKPAGFSIKSSTDDVLSKLVVDAVRQWRFLPAEIDGKPVATKVALPVKIVDPEGTEDRAASFE